MSEYPYCQADATPKLDAEANAFGESKAEAQKEIDRLKEEVERLKLALKECGGL